jgi:hypothetical protein
MAERRGDEGGQVSLAQDLVVEVTQIPWPEQKRRTKEGEQ